MILTRNVDFIYLILKRILFKSFVSTNFTRRAFEVRIVIYVFFYNSREPPTVRVMLTPFRASRQALRARERETGQGHIRAP